MDRVYSIEEQKIAEKLTILNTRCTGMLTQLYNVKKVRIWYNHHFFLAGNTSRIELLLNLQYYAVAILSDDEVLATFQVNEIGSWAYSIFIS